jgi:hypothetical protein
MISRPPSLCRSDSFEIECTEIEPIDKRVDHTDRIILVDPVVQTFRKQNFLPDNGCDPELCVVENIQPTAPEPLADIILPPNQVHERNLPDAKAPDELEDDTDIR